MYFNPRFGPHVAVICTLFFLLSFFSVTTFGQGKFLEGYIISPKGDTTKGFIRYEAWNASPTYIDYSPSQNGKYFQKLDDEHVWEFYIPSAGERYKSRTIGVLDINPDELYSAAPSLETKDSARIYLREVIYGSKASLFAQTSLSGVTKFFLEKNNALIELKNYSFNRVVGDKKYFVIYDEYKKQLQNLFSDSQNFREPLPEYDQRGLARYIKKYNQSFSENVVSVEAAPTQSTVMVDLHVSAGIESWDEYYTTFKNKLSTGLGVRISFPRNFHNRYIRFNFQVISGVLAKDVKFHSGDEKITLKVLEGGLGTYVGSGKIRPYGGIDFSFPFGEWRSIILGPHIGVGFKRQFNIEISHGLNLFPLMTHEDAVSGARISFNYYLNLNKFF
jgi:hypothetical protein